MNTSEISFVIANWCMSSNQSGDGEMRCSRIEDGTVSCMASS